jgi:translation initiation factor 2 subunit 3
VPIPIPSDYCLIIICSFDVNTPGAEVNDLKGSVASGSILTGVLQLGQEVEIRSGIETKMLKAATASPSAAKSSLRTKSNHLQFAVVGGLIGVGMKIDPTLCIPDHFVGQVLGAVGKLLKAYTGKDTYFQHPGFF